VSRRAILGVVVPGLVVLHFLLHVGFSIEGWAPDLLTLALLLAARETNMGIAAGLGFFFGLMEDSFSVLAFGASALALSIVGILGARTRDLFVGDSVLFLFVYLSLGKLARDLIYWGVADPAVRGGFLDSVIIGGGLGALYLGLVGLALLQVAGGGRQIR
jgi:rod shape-determining protein MreD